MLYFSIHIPNKEIIGSWKLKSFDTIDFIRSSPEYAQGSQATREEIDGMVDLMLENTYYHFLDSENLVYTDLKGDEMIERKAVYKINDEDDLTMKEIERPFARQAKIIELTDDVLIISPVVNNKVGAGKMVFDRVKNNDQKGN